MKMILVGLVLALLGAQANAATGTSIGARGGKKSIARSLDNSGYPLQIADDKAWKVFELSASGAVQIKDEAGVAPKQGIIHSVCVSTGVATDWGVVYDSNTTTGMGQTVAGVKALPVIALSTSVAQCFVVNALFTSGAVVDGALTNASEGIYVYWRELGGYK